MPIRTNDRHQYAGERRAQSPREIELGCVEGDRGRGLVALDDGRPDRLKGRYLNRISDADDQRQCYYYPGFDQMWGMSRPMLK